MRIRFPGIPYGGQLAVQNRCQKSDLDEGEEQKSTRARYVRSALDTSVVLPAHMEMFFDKRQDGRVIHKNSSQSMTQVFAN